MAGILLQTNSGVCFERAESREMQRWLEAILNKCEFSPGGRLEGRIDVAQALMLLWRAVTWKSYLPSAPMASSASRPRNIQSRAAAASTSN